MPVFAMAQTGPGGVGNTSGSGGQPENVFWLKGDVGASVSQWLDQSGNANHFEQNSSGNQPTISTINGFDVLQFDGSNDWMGSTVAFTPSEIPETNYTQFILFETTDNTGPLTTVVDPISPSSGSHDRQFGLYNSKFSSRIWNQEIISSTGNYDDGTAHVAWLQVDNSSGQYLFVDGDQVASGSKNTSDFDFESGMVIGGHTYWDYYNGKIGEIILYNAKLSDAEQTIVATYIANKYNASTSGTLVEAYNYTSTYFDNFAGIGQASDGSNHTESYSAELRINSPSALDNGDYLFFGHDGGSNSVWNTNELPSDGKVDQRIAREWRFHEIDGGGGDGVGTITVGMDSDDLPTVVNGTTYFILVDSDGDFSSVGDQTRYEMSNTSGTLYEATNVAIANGDHITFAIGAYPSSVTNLTATNNLNQRVLLNWDPVLTDVTGSSTSLTGDEYRIYQNTADNFSGASQVATSSSTNDVEITGLTNETTYYFWVTAINGVGESSESSSASGIPALKVYFSVSSSTGDESSGISNIDIELSDTHTSDVDVTVTADGQAGATLRSVSGIASITNGGSGYSVGDLIGENDGADGGSGLNIEVTAVSGGVITGAQVVNGGTGYTSAPSSFTELSGTGSGATFTLNLQAVGNDYTLNPSNPTVFTISAASTTVTLTSADLAINNDAISENTEKFELTLSGPTTTGTSVSLGSQTTHLVNISDDDLSRKVFLVDDLNTLDDGLSSDAEENTTTYTVALNTVDNVNDTSIEWQIDYSSGSTTADSADVTSYTGTETITAGNISTTFDLPINDDADYESNEAIEVRLVGASNANIDDNPSSPSPPNGRYGSILHTIENNADLQPQISFSTATSSIPDEASTPSIDVELSNTSGEDITATIAVISGTATGSGTDYNLLISDVTIPSGSFTVTIDDSDLSIINDALDENNETLTLEIQSITNGSATIDSGADTHELTITDDDAQPSVSFSQSSSSAIEDNLSATVTLELSTLSGRDVTVDYSLAGSAASGGGDYSDDDGGSVTIIAGSISTDINFSLVDDAIIEGSETIDISFIGGDITNATAGATTSHTLSIGDDDFGSTGPGGVGSSDGLSNLLIWLSADSLNSLSDGANVASWPDESGHGHDFAQATGSNQPTYHTGVINNKPVVRFDGSSHWLGSDAGTYTPSELPETNYTQFVVFSSSDGNAAISAVVDPINPGAGSHDRQFGLNGNKFSSRLWSNETITSGSNFNDGSPHIGVIVVENNGGQTLYVDGTQVASGSKGSSDFDFESGMVLGAGPSWGFFQGDLTEFIQYDYALEDSRRIIIENYLAEKYNISINNDYYSVSGLQESLVAIGTQSATHEVAESGGIVLDAGNANFSDGDFIAAAHNDSLPGDGTTTYISSTPTIIERWAREWGIEITGSPTGNIIIGFDFGEVGLPFNPTNANNYQLLHRSGSSADFSIVSGVTTKQIVGDQIQFILPIGNLKTAGNPNQFLASGDQFTLGTTDNDNSPLPISLNRVIIKPVDGGATINWNTATERENFGFFIDRFYLGLDMTTPKDTLWKEIGFIQGNGTRTKSSNYSFTDTDIESAGRYIYRIRQVNYNGKENYYGPYLLRVDAPDKLELNTIYPNPFNPTTTITYSVNKQADVKIRVFNVLGQRVQTLVNRQQLPGKYSVRFDGTGLSNGIYFIRFISEGVYQTRKVLLVK